MKNYLIYSVALAIAALFTGCTQNVDDDIYENYVYLNSSVRSTKLYVSTEDSYSIQLSAALPKPAENKILVRYMVDESLVSVYNQTNGTDAVILPLENYYFSSQRDYISEGSVESESVDLEFVDVLDLNKEVLYVLPVRLVSNECQVLESRAINYYVFEGAQLINVVADMWQNYCSIDWKNKNVMNDMSAVTIEMLLNADWSKCDDSNCSLIGVEGFFLLRLGDLSNPNDELELCTNGGGSAPKVQNMPTNEWFHLAITYDCATKLYTCYINGEKKASGTTGNYGSTISLGRDDFKINTAYNNSRYACAKMSEVRVWSKCLTQEEISGELHPYYVDPASPGLVAYWKFNEGSGTTIVDRTGNGNDAVAANAVNWLEVSLPE